MVRPKSKATGVVVVSVDAPEADGHTVDADQAVLQLDLAESYILLHGVCARGPGDGELDGVEMWCFCCPF